MPKICDIIITRYHKITEKLCIMAVNKEGTTLRYVPENMKTEKICIMAVKNNSKAIQYVPDKSKKILTY